MVDKFTESWMSQIADSKRLQDLSIPGTHDSCSLYGYCQPISTTQYAKIDEQLNAGIRFFDLRIKTEGDDQLKMVHGLEDIGGYYDKSGKLLFKTVLEEIYKWMNIEAHQKECVIIKVLDCDNDGLNTESKGYDTDTRVHNIWKSVDDSSPIKRLEFNTTSTTEDFMNLTMKDVRGKLILWRVFKYTSDTIIAGVYKEFGLNLYQLKDTNNCDNKANFDVVSPSSSITRKNIHTLHSQSLYQWTYSGTSLTYADKMNAILRLLYDAWCGHTPGTWENTMNYYCVNELNIATAYNSPGNRQDVDAGRYYPITNATIINPLLSEMLDNLLSPPSHFPVLPSSAPPKMGSLGILLFDWADSPTDVKRNFNDTRCFNEPIYRKVIDFNFRPSYMFNLESIKYDWLSDYPYASLKY